jgi:LacI family transcriptional regulator
MITYETGLLNLRERERGYEEALAGAGLESNIGRVGSEETAKDVHTLLQQWFSGNREVDAILFASNLLSTYGLKYLNAQNIRVPHDVAIVSFDESDAAELFYAPLTHIRQPLAAMGEKAVQILLRAIEGDKLPVQVMEKAELVIGKSSLPKGSE